MACAQRLAGVVILAGGASTRMGTPKATLSLPTGERLLDYHVRHARNLHVPLMIADNERGFRHRTALSEDQAQLPIQHIRDYGADSSHAAIKTGGALVAIESALQTLIAMSKSPSSTSPLSSWLMVMSCDSLIPASDLWDTLQPYVTRTTDKSVICLSDDSHLYPLLGLYRLSIEPELKHYIETGERRVMSFITPMVQPVSLPDDWQQLTNFNTPNEFRDACAALTN